jgi:hypothetical protein
LDDCLKYLPDDVDFEEEIEVSEPIQMFKSESYFAKISGENGG